VINELQGGKKWCNAAFESGFWPQFCHSPDFQGDFSKLRHNLARFFNKPKPIPPAKFFAMKQLFLALAATISFQTMFAQDVTYVLFNRDCMNQLEYRYSYPNLKGDNSVWAYSVKPNVQEHFIFMTEGAGHYSPELPKGTVSCRNLNLDDAFVAAINRGVQQMLVVFQRQSGGYWLMPVKSSTLVARNGSRYWVRSPQSSFHFDSLRLVNEQNLAVVGSFTAAYFSGAKLRNCLMEYSFRCEPIKSSQNRSDIQIIPGIGITVDRTGNSASQAMENEIQLVKVNGKVLDDYITESCPEGVGKIAISKSTRPADYGEGTFEADKEIRSIMQKEQENPSPVVHTTGADGIQCAEDWEPGTHIVQKGENLRAIARTYKVSEQQLVAWNKIANPNLIEVCQKIWLKKPPATAVAAQSAPKGAVPHTITPAESGKTVKIQGPSTVHKGTQASAIQKSYDPNRPITHSDAAYYDPNTYQYFEREADKTAGARVHTVHRGEYLYKIAKMYNCPEECIRVANNFPAEGDQPLSIGQQIIIPECSCTMNGKDVVRPTATNPGLVKRPSLTDKAPDSRVKVRSSILDEAQTPQVHSTEQPVRPQNLYEETSLYSDEAARLGSNKTADNNKKTATESAPKVPLFREHHVKQGENLRSIATKYRVDAAELSQVNGLDPKENLTPGKLIMVPIEDN